MNDRAESFGDGKDPSSGGRTMPPSHQSTIRCVALEYVGLGGGMIELALAMERLSWVILVVLSVLIKTRQKDP